MVVKEPMDTRTQQVRALFDQTDGYLRKRFDVELRALIVREPLGEVHDSNILDIGCGDGSISLQFAKPSNRIVLLDLSDKMLELAKKNTPEEVRESVEFVNSSVDEFEPGRQFDVVLVIGVLAHVSSVEGLIRRITQLLKPGGRCVIQSTDNDKLTGKWMNFYYRLRDALRGKRRHRLNIISGTKVTALAREHGLRQIAGRRYCSPMLGMGNLPNEWLYRYELYTLTNRWISRMGSETVRLYVKDA